MNTRKRIAAIAEALRLATRTTSTLTMRILNRDEAGAWFVKSERQTPISTREDREIDVYIHRTREAT